MGERGESSGVYLLKALKYTEILKNKDHRKVSTEVEKSFDKTQHPFMIQWSLELGRSDLSIIKAINDNSPQIVYSLVKT